MYLEIKKKERNFFVNSRIFNIEKNGESAMLTDLTCTVFTRLSPSSNSSLNLADYAPEFSTESRNFLKFSRFLRIAVRESGVRRILRACDWSGAATNGKR